jgi:hypothetical protein
MAEGVCTQAGSLSLKVFDGSHQLRAGVPRMKFAKRWLLPTVLALCTATQSGCLTLGELMNRKSDSALDTTFLETQGYSIPAGGMPSPVAPNPSGAPRVILEVRDGKKHLESIPLPMDRAVFIEDIVQEARLHDRFGNLVISIMRPTELGGPPVRLDVQIDSSGKAANAGQNYALMPGDHIVVNSDNRSSLERFIDTQFRDRG